MFIYKNHFYFFFIFKMKSTHVHPHRVKAYNDLLLGSKRIFKGDPMKLLRSIDITKENVIGKPIDIRHNHNDIVGHISNYSVDCHQLYLDILVDDRGNDFIKNHKMRKESIDAMDPRSEKVSMEGTGFSISLRSPLENKIDGEREITTVHSGTLTDIAVRPGCYIQTNYSHDEDNSEIIVQEISNLNFFENSEPKKMSTPDSQVVVSDLPVVVQPTQNAPVVAQPSVVAQPTVDPRLVFSDKYKNAFLDKKTPEEQLEFVLKMTGHLYEFKEDNDKHYMKHRDATIMEFEALEIPDLKKEDLLKRWDAGEDLNFTLNLLKSTMNKTKTPKAQPQVTNQQQQQQKRTIDAVNQQQNPEEPPNKGSKPTPVSRNEDCFDQLNRTGRMSIKSSEMMNIFPNPRNFQQQQQQQQQIPQKQIPLIQTPQPQLIQQNSHDAPPQSFNTYEDNATKFANFRKQCAMDAKNGVTVQDRLKEEQSKQRVDDRF
jgi:hypothetical protein